MNKVSYQQAVSNINAVKSTTAQEKASAIKALDSYYPKEQMNSVVNPVTNTTPSKITSPVLATDLKPVSTPEMPEPMSGSIYDTYTTSLQKSLEDIRKNLESTYSTKFKELDTQKTNLQKEQEKYLKEIDPTKRDTYEQEKRIEANQLQAAETASKTLEEDFTRRRSLTSELETLLTESNALIKKEQGLPVSQRVINTRVSNRLTDISARTGVIEAVFSAIDGNISQAHNLINQAKNTVSANWNDNLNYYNTLLDLNNKKILNLDAESKNIAEKQVALIENDLFKVDKTVDYLKSLMIDPETSQFVADAGVKLTDSVEEINTKLAAQSRVKEIADIKNEMVTSGYTYVPFPTSTAGLIPITAGGQTMYFKPKPEETKTASATAIKANEIKTFSDFIKTGIAPSGEKFGNPIGEDGFADPTVYVTAFEEWGGTINEFLSKFPVKQYVNPESYDLLPESIRPKKSNSSESKIDDDEFIEMMKTW